MLLIVEDSESDSLLLRHHLSNWFPNLEIQICSTWMSAVQFIREASFVVIDWNLEDGINAQESGALTLLKKLNTPHSIFCGSPEYLPSDISCDVVNKNDLDQLKTKMESVLNGK